MSTSAQQKEYRKALEEVELAKQKLKRLREKKGVNFNLEMNDIQMSNMCCLELKCEQNSGFLDCMERLGGCEQELVHWAKGTIATAKRIPKKIRKEMLEVFNLLKYRSMKPKVIEFANRLDPIIKQGY